LGKCGGYRGSLTPCPERSKPAVSGPPALTR
jgi:hypothetical protein